MWWDEYGRIGVEPFWRLRQLQRNMNSLFEGYAGERGVFPSVNVWSNSEETLVMAELPGVDPDKLTVTVTGDHMTLEGERQAEALPEGGVCHREERGFGKFSRTLRLPFEIAAGQVKARVKNGVVTIRLPRSDASKPRKIAVAAG